MISVGDGGTEAGPSGLYVPPALRRMADSNASKVSDAVRRRVKGCLNKLAESNLFHITAELAEVYRQYERRAVMDSITEEILQVLPPRACHVVLVKCWLLLHLH